MRHALKSQTAGLADEVIPSASGVDQLCGPDGAETSQASGLAYTTAPLAWPQVVAGPIGVDLYASSTRPDAEFIVDVSTVAPDGHVTSLQSGALLGSLRQEVKAKTWFDSKGHVASASTPSSASPRSH